jgi:predicted MFS family arabinose efflux permease
LKFNSTYISGLLMFMADVRLLGVSVILTTLGMLGQSFYLWGGAPQFSWAVVNMVILSTGVHLFMPLSSSVTLRLSENGQIGRNLGLLNGAQTAASIIGCVIIWVGMGWLKLNYGWVLRCAAFFGLLAIGCAFMMKVQHRSAHSGVKIRLLFRKEYALFYWLSILYGARKQVFLTFAPWVIVKVYGQKPLMMATLTFIAAVIGIVFKPWLGWLIDRLGERKIISAEAVLFLGVCLGYAFAGRLGLGESAVYLVFACFIIDLLLSSVAMARTTYLHKHLVAEEDLTPTLSMGISMDHMIAMSVPMLGGLLWERLGFESIFLAAGVLAIANFFIAHRMPGQPAGAAAAV